MPSEHTKLLHRHVRSVFLETTFGEILNEFGTYSISNLQLWQKYYSQAAFNWVSTQWEEHTVIILDHFTEESASHASLSTREVWVEVHSFSKLHTSRWITVASQQWEHIVLEIRRHNTATHSSSVINQIYSKTSLARHHRHKAKFWREAKWRVNGSDLL